MAYTPTDNPYIPGDPYSYDLKWIVAKIKEALSSIEGLTTGQSDLSNDFEALREYVYDYFNNLDISQEVEDKINELYAAGFFDDIIEEWMNGHIKWTNPNLLDNPWFTVNQRAFTSGTLAADYFIDRWRAARANVSYSNNIVVFSWTGTESTFGFINQRMGADSAYLTGKSISLSIQLSDDTIYTTTFTPSNTTPRTATIGPLTMAFTWNATYGYYLELRNYSTSNVALKAVKLEIGPYSTLANDAPPNYAEELAKCQRYFIRYRGTEDITLGLGYATSASSVVFNLFTPVTMRQTPSATLTGSFLVYGAGNADSVSVVGMKANNIGMRATGTYEVDKIYRLRLQTNSDYIDLSAEL